MLGEEPKVELYNLIEDPVELYNIAHDHPDLIDKFSSIIRKEHTRASTERFRIPLLDADTLKLTIQ